MLTVVPLGLVMLSYSVDQGVEARMQERLRTVAEDAAFVLARDGGIEPHALDAIAREHGVRLRVVTSDRTVDLDRDESALAELFFSDDGAPTMAQFDATLGPLMDREEVLEAGGGTVVGCRAPPAGQLCVCHAARSVSVGGTTYLVYAQESSRRSVRALYDLRYQLLKLTLVVLPLSLLLAWWLGRRFVRPVEELERMVRQNVDSGSRRPIELDRGDELGDLAASFDELVGRLDARARANEAFLAEVAHELKSPVATVRACAEALESPSTDPERARRLARALDESSRRMDRLLRQLLALAKAEAGMPDVARSEVGLGALAREVVEDARLRHERVELSVTVDQPEPTLVAVPDAVEGAVRNLVDNAASFASAVKTTVTRADGEVWLTVEDDGPGIAPDVLPHIFDRFFTTRPKNVGTGLGLSLVRAVVEAHGGTVSVHSTLGAGARFELRFPARPAGLS